MGWKAWYDALRGDDYVDMSQMRTGVQEPGPRTLLCQAEKHGLVYRASGGIRAALFAEHPRYDPRRSPGRGGTDFLEYANLLGREERDSVRRVQASYRALPRIEGH